MTLDVFHDFPGLENGLTKFHDFPGRVVTLDQFGAEKWYDKQQLNKQMAKQMRLELSIHQIVNNK